MSIIYMITILALIAVGCFILYKPLFNVYAYLINPKYAELDNNLYHYLNGSYEYSFSM